MALDMYPCTQAIIITFVGGTGAHKRGCPKAVPSNHTLLMCPHYCKTVFYHLLATLSLVTGETESTLPSLQNCTLDL